MNLISQLPCTVGDKVLIRTVTMIQVGRIRSIGDTFLVLDEGGWIADTGRFGRCLAEGTINEFEKVPGWMAVHVGSIVDLFPWDNDLPKSTI